MRWPQLQAQALSENLATGAQRGRREGMRGNQGWWVGITLSVLAACGQELVLPQGANKPKTTGEAPSQGFTGAGGAAEQEADSSSRLPVAEQPIFTTFGGAGGDAATDGAGGANSGGAPDHVVAGPKVGEGGRPGGAGAGATMGGKSAGGASASAGTSAGDANAGSGSVANGPAALLFSEYVEGSGSFKALEIYALEASSLEGCELQTYSNGKFEPSRVALHGQLGRGEVQVLCSSSLATAQPSICDRSTNLNFNGDDALALSCGGHVLDVIGQIGVDPGDSWGVGATLDHTLRRRCDVVLGRSDGSTPFEIDAEWLTLGADTFSELGVRNCTP